jgi:NAD(P)H-hydrate epimerase
MILEPLELLTPGEMAIADRLTIAGGMIGIDLMERAGAAVADTVIARYTPRPTLVLCGPGNNGGDGFVVARILAAGRWPVRLACTVPLARLKGDAALAAAKWPGPVQALNDTTLDGQHLVIDALYGAGLDRAIDGLESRIIQDLSLREIETVAVDIPSGVQGADGSIDGVAVNASLTVTFFRRKPGHLLMPGAERCGEIVLADIGISADVLPRIQPSAWENKPGLWLKRYPWPKGDTNKYARGHVLVAGGAMSGAGRLAAHATQRIGAGLVTVACPAEVEAIYAGFSPSLIVHAVAHTAEIAEIIETRKVKAVLAGPGGGIGETLHDTIVVMMDSGKPAVFDADALSVIAQSPDLRAKLKEHHVLTPHEGEFKRLFDYEGSRLDRARRAARDSGATILLKGSDTIVARPDGTVAINSNATPWLATGGSGDTLSGLIAGLLGQGMDPFDAACAGMWIHAECGRAFGPGLIADDLANEVPGVLRTLLGLSS